MPIDWNATGVMISGLGAFAGAGAIAYAAWKAADTFDQWKLQRVDERRTAIAEQALALMFRLRETFPRIRSPITLPDEGMAAEESLRTEGLIDETSDPDRVFRLRIAQTILRRIDENQETFDNLADLRPAVWAVFGAEAEGWLRRLAAQRAKIRSAAVFFGQERDRSFADEEQAAAHSARLRRWEGTFWEGGEIGDDGQEIDLVAEELERSFGALEALFRPYMEHGLRSASKLHISPSMGDRAG